MDEPRRIVIADDEAPIRRVIEVKLKKRGYRVLMAKNGREGLELIRENLPNVAILDINMPLLDGKTLCRMTNELKTKHPFLTIMITARIVPEDREWVKEMQDTLLMEKPFSPGKLVNTIEHYFDE